MRVLIRRTGNLLELSTDGTNPLPAEVDALVRQTLTYKHVKHLRGREAFNPVTREYQRVRVQDTAMYAHDGRGRLLALRGFRWRLQDLLRAHQVDFEYVDLEPAKANDVYQPDWAAVLSRVEFRERQEECLIRLATHDMGIIQAPPGFGKSFLMGLVPLLFPKARIDIIVKLGSLFEQIYRDVLQHTPNVGRVGHTKVDWKRVTLISAGSIHRSDGEADIVLAEEMHQLIAKKAGEGLSRYTHARMFGFSATPEGRSDQADIRGEGLFGRTIFEMTYQEGVALGLVVPIEVRWYSVPGGDPASGVRSPVRRKQLAIWTNYQRNATIAAAVRLHSEHQILVLVETLEHALYLRQHLPEFSLVYGGASVKGQRIEKFRKLGLFGEQEQLLTDPQRTAMKREFVAGRLRYVIATDIWGTGVDIRNLRVTARASGNTGKITDYQQGGRPSRLADGTEKPFGILLDFLDEFSTTDSRRAAERRRNYAKHGWSQVMPDGTRI